MRVHAQTVLDVALDNTRTGLARGSRPPIETLERLGIDTEREWAGGRHVSQRITSYAKQPSANDSAEARAMLYGQPEAIKTSEDALYVSKRGRLAAVLLGVERYAELIERIEYLEDSHAALQARDERDEAVPWSEVRG
jgi:PHD/YefM family antitoxin component YafN of YafNO toxin-antitoxin module